VESSQSVKLYDTKHQQVMDVLPSESGTVDIYCCGPTVYRFAHVGNLRTFLLGDLVRRTLRAEGMPFRYIQNITDVGHLNDDIHIDVAEDKILAQAKLENKDPFEIARFYERAFHDDLAALNILVADAYPKASESINLIIDMIAQLIYIGAAYQGNDGSLYFSARSYKDYGAISKNSLDQLRAGYRFDSDNDKEEEKGKRFHADWALWKAASINREMTWPTPWGVGFPGWHIECSAMSIHYFPRGVSLHLGGIDLRFPHHENERAQSNVATNFEFVRQWVHGEHLLFDGKKMAKSSGNVLHIADLIARKIDPLAIRLLFMESHYRTQLNLTWESIEAAHSTLKRWRKKIASWPAGGLADRALIATITSYFSNDLDTSAALLQLRKFEKDESVPEQIRRATFLELDALLALNLGHNLALGDQLSDLLPPGAEQLLEERQVARLNKNWQLSDRLRDQLLQIGVQVSDGPEGQAWEIL
jgi:cysteinyl-tRNA synthetase